MERIADHAENIAELIEEMISEKAEFSQNAISELDEMIEAVFSSFNNALEALDTGDVACASRTKVFEDQVDNFEKKLRASHINRLSHAQCSVSSGIHFLEMLTNLERVSDHAMNISEVVLNENR